MTNLQSIPLSDLGIESADDLRDLKLLLFGAMSAKAAKPGDNPFSTITADTIDHLYHSVDRLQLELQLQDDKQIISLEHFTPSTAAVNELIEETKTTAQ